MEHALRKVCAGDVELRVVFMFPDVLGESDRVEDVRRVEQSADPSMCWLLLMRAVGEKRLSKRF